MLRLFSVFLLACTALLPAHAEPAADVSEIDFQAYTPVTRPVRISTDQAPKIDGDLSDPIWQSATRIDRFYQVEPTIARPEVETHVFLAYDENALYVAVHAFEDHPEDIYATIMTRDGDVWRDDMIRFYIDSFDTGISGFGFDVNALGARADRLVQAGRRPVDEWDTIWDSAGQVVEDGWVAEIAIPFRSISFDVESTGWGLMLTRERSHKAQEYRWAAIDQSVTAFSMSRAGRLEGIKDVNRGIGLEIEIKGTAKLKRDWDRPRDDDIRLEPGGNILYKFTPSLTGLFTLNSDFSGTPLDTRQINTGRFSLFFPETRDFFLQDAAFFEFGGQAFSGAPNGQPFFSRRIGIVQGQSLTMDAGVKLSGELNGVELGILSARMSEGDNLDAQTLSVARATIDLSPNSRLGGIVTNGDPGGRSDNTLYGMDYLFQTPSLLGGGRLQADIYAEQSVSSVHGTDEAYGALVDYPNDKWNWRIAMREVGTDFRPALGFVNRPGSRTYSGKWQRRFRQNSPALNWWQVGTSHEYITDLNGRLETRESALNAAIQNRATDQLEMSVFETFERTFTPFFLPTGIIVPPGEYHNDGASMKLTTSMVRPYGVEVELKHNNFYGGESTIASISALARPNRFLNLEAAYSRTDISVSGGDVSVHIGSIDTVVNVTPKLSVSTQTQYDNISQSLSVFGRLQWELRPETEVFMSLGHGAFIEGNDFGRDFRSIQTRAILRFGHTLRF